MGTKRACDLMKGDRILRNHFGAWRTVVVLEREQVAGKVWLLVRGEYERAPVFSVKVKWDAPLKLASADAQF